MDAALASNEDYKTAVENAERMQRELDANNFTDMVDSSGNTVTADFQRQQTQKSLNMAKEAARNERAKVTQQLQQKGKQELAKRDQELARERDQLLGKQAQLTREKNESTRNFRTEQKAHKDATKALEDKKLGYNRKEINKCI